MPRTEVAVPFAATAEYAVPVTAADEAAEMPEAVDVVLASEVLSSSTATFTAAATAVEDFAAELVVAVAVADLAEDEDEELLYEGFERPNWVLSITIVSPTYPDF